MEIGVIFATLLLLGVLFLVIRLVLGPLKVISMFFLHCGIALVALVIVNFAGRYFGLHLPINPVSVMSIGVLGVPGFLLVAFLSFLLG